MTPLTQCPKITQIIRPSLLKWDDMILVPCGPGIQSVLGPDAMGKFPEIPFDCPTHFLVNDFAIHLAEQADSIITTKNLRSQATVTVPFQTFVLCHVNVRKGMISGIRAAGWLYDSGLDRIPAKHPGCMDSTMAGKNLVLLIDGDWVNQTVLEHREGQIPKRLGTLQPRIVVRVDDEIGKTDLPNLGPRLELEQQQAQAQSQESTANH